MEFTTPPREPQLIAISHGTSSLEGHTAVASLVAAVAARLPEIEVRSGYVDVERPTAAETLSTLPEGSGAVVVPLLLSAGYHVHVDLTQAVRAASGQVALAYALGPDARLARILSERLIEAGYRTGDRVILAAAGSSDSRAVADCRTVADLLAIRLGHPVTLAFHTAHSPTLAEAIANSRAVEPERRVAVSSYLLAPGYFHRLAEMSDADVVTEPIISSTFGPPERLVELVCDRYFEALAVRANTPQPREMRATAPM